MTKRIKNDKFGKVLPGRIIILKRNKLKKLRLFSKKLNFFSKLTKTI